VHFEFEIFFEYLYLVFVFELVTKNILYCIKYFLESNLHGTGTAIVPVYR